MHKVYIEISQTTEVFEVEVSKGTTVLGAIRSCGLMFESPCNGNGTCGKCAIDKAEIKPLELLEIVESDNGRSILACQTCIMGDIKIKLIKEEQEKEEEQGSPSFGKIIIKSAPTQNIPMQNIATQNNLAQNVSTKNASPALALSVDIGTTTLVASLQDCKTGETFKQVSTLNPQAIYAQDLMSRVLMAEEPEGLHKLHTCLIEAINDLIGDSENIREIVLCANTAMLHIASNTSTESLSEYPYSSSLEGDSYITALSLGIKGALQTETLAQTQPVAQTQAQAHTVAQTLGQTQVAQTHVYIPPIISPFIGSDISAGLLELDIFDAEGITLFIDMGTNGEIVLADNGKVIACSVAAGPAFEGMGIKCGMRAEAGAVEQFRMLDNGEFNYKTIGNAKARGICGSGLIDIVGQLVKAGIIKKDGAFAKEGRIEFLIEEGLALTQKDIRQLQLAKGAITAGVETLLKELDKPVDSVDRVLLAGSFGYHLRPENLSNIALLPAGLTSKIEFVGNTSLSGGQTLLLHPEKRQQLAEQISDIQVIELANNKAFQTSFINNLEFN